MTEPIVYGPVRPRRIPATAWLVLVVLLGGWAYDQLSDAHTATATLTTVVERQDAALAALRARTDTLCGVLMLTAGNVAVLQSPPVQDPGTFSYLLADSLARLFHCPLPGRLRR